VVSILGMVVLNTMFLEINWGIITAHEDYVPFPATGTRTKTLRALGKNPKAPGTRKKTA
jgi:hypothetical protein